MQHISINSSWVLFRLELISQLICFLILQFNRLLQIVDKDLFPNQLLSLVFLYLEKLEHRG